MYFNIMFIIILYCHSSEWFFHKEDLTSLQNQKQSIHSCPDEAPENIQHTLPDLFRENHIQLFQFFVHRMFVIWIVKTSTNERKKDIDGHLAEGYPGGANYQE